MSTFFEEYLVRQQLRELRHLDLRLESIGWFRQRAKRSAGSPQPAAGDPAQLKGQEPAQEHTNGKQELRRPRLSVVKSFFR